MLPIPIEGTGPFREGKTDRLGFGQGGPGKGRGGGISTEGAKEDAEGPLTRIPSRLTPDRAPVYIGPSVKELPKEKPSKTPFFGVTPADIREAEEAIEREEIPPAFKHEVKEYFESLKGGQ